MVVTHCLFDRSHISRIFRIFIVRFDIRGSVRDHIFVFDPTLQYINNNNNNNMNMNIRRTNDFKTTTSSHKSSERSTGLGPRGVYHNNNALLSAFKMTDVPEKTRRQTGVHPDRAWTTTEYNVRWKTCDMYNTIRRCYGSPSGSETIALSLMRDARARCKLNMHTYEPDVIRSTKPCVFRNLGVRAVGFAGPSTRERYTCLGPVVVVGGGGVKRTG